MDDSIIADGAHYGVEAGKALSVVLSNEPPDPNDCKSVEEMYDEIMAAHWPGAVADLDYSAHANCVAKLILDWINEDTSRAADPPADVYVEGENQPSEIGWCYRMIGGGRFPGDLCPNPNDFSWGWSVNAARRCLELPPVPNPGVEFFAIQFDHVREPKKWRGDPDV